MPQNKEQRELFQTGWVSKGMATKDSTRPRVCGFHRCHIESEGAGY